MGTSLAHKAYTYILNRILQNEYVPGQIINRREIAQTLGISISPVTEAMVLLENEGLLETFSRKGTQVRVVTDDDFAGYLFLREAIECSVVRLIAGKRIYENREELLRLARLVDTATWGNLEYYYADKDFHQALVDLCQNSAISKEYHRISTLGLYFTPTHIRLKGSFDGGVNHCELVTLLAESSSEDAARILQRHIHSGKGSLPLPAPGSAGIDCKSPYEKPNGVGRSVNTAV